MGALVGVVSERDIALIGAVTAGKSDEITVEEAMSAEPYAVSPTDKLLDVTAHMAEHKFGCAVVMDHNKVVGVFTTTDALHMLSGILRSADTTPAVKALVDKLKKRG